MNKKKIAYLPVLDFGSAELLYDQMMTAYADMQKEDLILFDEEKIKSSSHRRSEYGAIGLLPWPTFEDMSRVTDMERAEFDELRTKETRGEELEIYLKNGGSCGYIDLNWCDLFARATMQGYKVMIRDFAKEDFLRKQIKGFYE